MTRSFFYATRADGAPFGFTHKGREYRLYRRVESNVAPYYFDFRRTVNGRKTACGCCLKTNDRELAVKRAKARLDEVDLSIGNEQFGIETEVRGQRAEGRGQIATLGECIAAFRKIMGATNVEGSVGALRRVVRGGHTAMKPVAQYPRAVHVAACAAVDVLPASVLTDLLVQQLERRKLAGLPKHGRQSALVSLKAELANARRIFSAARRHAMTRPDGEFKLHLPDLTGFLTYKTAQPLRVPKQKPSRELLLKTFAAAHALLASDPNAYVAWRLACYSMRRGDIGRAELSWIKLEDFNDDADFTQPAVLCWVLSWQPNKTGREVMVRLPEEEAALFAAHVESENGGVRNAECGTRSERPEWERKYLVTAGPGAKQDAKKRCGAVFERVNTWMRGLGWTTRHTLHEMRALYARMKTAQFAAAYAAGLQSAATDLGHRNSHTTAASYTGEMSLASEKTVVRFPEMRKEQT